jgi:hypothetical protein
MGRFNRRPFYMNIITTKVQREKRLETCKECPDKVVRFGSDVCGLCNCPLAGKSILIAAKCPAGKWELLPC